MHAFARDADHADSTASGAAAGISGADRPIPFDETERTVQRHSRGVWRYVRMLGASPDLADDLTQEAFVVALGKGALRRQPAECASFLRQTARFLWLRRHRDAARTEAADVTDLLWERDAAHDGGDELVDQVRACVGELGELGERARRAIQLFYGDGLGRTAIAQALEMREAGVKTLMQRARRAIRECIQRKRT